MPNYAKARLYHVPQFAKCTIMQCMKLSEVQTYARCQSMQSKKLCKMQSQSRYKECKFQIFMKDQSYERWKIMQNTKQSNVHIQGVFLAVTWQLYRFRCHSLTESLSHSLPLLKNTTKEHSERLVTLESDDETWPDKQKDNDNDKDKNKDNDNDKDIWGTPSNSNPRDFWPLKHLIRVMRRHDLTD